MKASRHVGACELSVHRDDETGRVCACTCDAVMRRRARYTRVSVTCPRPHLRTHRRGRVPNRRRRLPREHPDVESALGRVEPGPRHRELQTRAARLLAARVRPAACAAAAATPGQRVVAPREPITQCLVAPATCSVDKFLDVEKLMRACVPPPPARAHTEVVCPSGTSPDAPHRPPSTFPAYVYRRRFADNLENMQWLKAFYEKNYAGQVRRETRVGRGRGGREG